MIKAIFMQYHVEFDLDFKRNTFPGKFVVIEGIDGSGKTTQANIVVEKLKAQGKDVIYTKEPTTGPIGKFIREGIAGGGTLPPAALQHLLSADRAVHEEEVKNYLKNGIMVISDRYLWSSVPYGLADLPGDRQVKSSHTGNVLLAAQSILSMYHQFILPDLTIYLTVSVNTAVARIEEMGKEKEMYEYRDKLTIIKEGYDWLLAQFPKEFVVIDGEKDLDKVTNEILKHI